MPRIERFSVTITTGSAGTEHPVRFDFNGHTMPFENTSGGTGPGESFEGSFAARSFAHSVALLGPDEGRWEIDRVTVRYEPADEEPYQLAFGPIMLDDATAVDIWQERPVPAFDV